MVHEGAAELRVAIYLPSRSSAGYGCRRRLVVAHEPDVDGGLEIELTNVLQHLALELYRQAPNRRDAAGGDQPRGDQRSGDPGRG